MACDKKTKGEHPLLFACLFVKRKLEFDPNLPNEFTDKPFLLETTPLTVRASILNLQEDSAFSELLLGTKNKLKRNRKKEKHL